MPSGVATNFAPPPPRKLLVQAGQEVTATRLLLSGGPLGGPFSLAPPPPPAVAGPAGALVKPLHMPNSSVLIQFTSCSLFRNQYCSGGYKVCSQGRNYHLTRVDKVQGAPSAGGPRVQDLCFSKSSTMLTKSKIHVTTGHELSGSGFTRQSVFCGHCMQYAMIGSFSGWLSTCTITIR